MKISNETKVGVFAAITITLLLLGYNFLKGNKLFSNDKTYYSIYDKVDGMKSSSFVQLHGLTIGRVMNLDLNSEEKIVATLVIKGGVKIPKNSVARILNSGLLGDKVVRLEFSDSKIIAEDGDTLISAKGENLSEGVIKEIAPIKEKAETVLSSMDSVLTLMKDIFSNKTRGNIESAVKNLNQSTEQLNTMMKNETVRLDKIFANVESITNNLNKSNKDITAILSNAASVTDSLKQADLLQTLNDAKMALADFALIMAKINKGEGSLGLLVNDKNLYSHLDSTASNLDKLMIDLKENPGRYVHLSVFGKKDKAKKK